MFKVTLILSVIALAVSSSIPSNGQAKVSVQVVSPEEMDNLLKQNPSARPMVREISQNSKLMGQTRNVVQYTVGRRISGDRIVAYDSGNNSWQTPQDVTLQIFYPSSGTGAIVSYVVIEVNQSNNLGRAYVMKGGVGYNYIHVVVEAKSTLWFNWAHNIYGI